MNTDSYIHVNILQPTIEKTSSVGCDFDDDDDDDDDYDDDDDANSGICGGSVDRHGDNDDDGTFILLIHWSTCRSQYTKK